MSFELKEVLIKLWIFLGKLWSLTWIVLEYAKQFSLLRSYKTWIKWFCCLGAICCNLFKLLFFMADSNDSLLFVILLFFVVFIVNSSFIKLFEIKLIFLFIRILSHTSFLFFYFYYSVLSPIPIESLNPIFWHIFNNSSNEILFYLTAQINVPKFALYFELTPFISNKLTYYYDVDNKAKLVIILAIVLSTCTKVSNFWLGKSNISFAFSFLFM